MIRAVLFDLGDTLVDFDAVDLKATFTDAARATYALLNERFPQKLPPFKTYHRRQNWSLQWTYFKSLITGREFNSVDVLKKSTRNMGITLPDSYYEEFTWQWYKSLAAAARFDDDVEVALAELQRRGLNLGLVSNTFVPGTCLDRQLDQENVLKYFPVRVYSCEVGVRKPKAPIFQAALEQVAAEPDETLFVGDSWRQDIRGARRMGMFAAYKTRRSAIPGLDDRTFQIERIGEIPGLVDAIDRQFGGETKGQAQ